MWAVDRCAGGRRYTLIGPATDATDATASTPRAGGQTARSAPSAQASMAGTQTSGLLAPRVPVCRPRLRASGRLGGVPGARGWRGPGALHVRHSRAGHQLNKIVILFKLSPKKWTF